MPLSVTDDAPADLQDLQTAGRKPMCSNCREAWMEQQMLDTVPNASLPGRSSNTATIYCTKVQEERDSSKNTGPKYTLWVSTTRL